MKNTQNIRRPTSSKAVRFSQKNIITKTRHLFELSSGEKVLNSQFLKKNLGVFGGGIRCGDGGGVDGSFLRQWNSISPRWKADLRVVVFTIMWCVVLSKNDQTRTDFITI